MNNENYHDDIIRELSLLYELSLTFGQSLKMKENSENFIKTLISRKNLDYGSVWIKSSLLDKKSNSEYSLVVAYPEYQIKSNNIDKDHTISKILDERDYAIIDESKPEFDKINTEKRISGGSYIIIKLGRIGFAKFYSSIKKEIFTRKEVNQFKGILLRFAVTLEGSIAYKRAIDEIKERKNAVNEMQALSKRFSVIVENIGNPILMADEDGKIILFNSDLEKLTGLEHKETTSLVKFKDACLTSDSAKAVFNLDEKASSIGTQNFDIEISSKDGNVKKVSINRSELIHLNKKQYIFTFSDITDSSKLSDELILKEHLLENSLNGLLVSATANVESKILFCNNTFKTLFNLDEEQVNERNFLSALTLDEDAALEIKKHLSKDEFETTIRLKDENDSDRTLNVKFKKIKDDQGIVNHYLAIAIDITEKEIDLQNSDQITAKLKSLQETAPGAMVFESNEEVISDFNNEFAELFNVDKEENDQSRELIDILSSFLEDTDEFKDKREEILKLKVKVKDEALNFKDGVTIKFDYVPIHFQGEYKGAYWFFRNETVLTAEFEKQNKLAENIKNVIDLLPVKAALINSKFEYQFMNKTYEDNFHIREWAIDKDDFEYCKKAGIEKSTAEYRKLNFERAVKDKEPVFFEEKRIKKDGGRKILLQNIMPVMDQNNEVSELVICGIDITELKKAENDADKIQKQLDALLATVDSAVFIFDDEGKILSANEASAQYFGFDKPEFIGKSITTFIAPIEKIETDNVIEKYYKIPLNGSASDKLESKGINREGEEFPVSLKFHLLYGNGRKIYLTVLTDNSENHNLTKELELKNKEIVKFVKEREEIFSNIQTEFETPLNAFANFTHLLLETDPKPEQNEMLNALKFSSENIIDKMKELTQETKSEVKKESAEDPPVSELVSVKEIIDNIVDSIQFAATSKSLKIETHFDPLIPEVVTGKRNLVFKVLNKLALNAVKFSNKGSVRLNSYLIDEDKEKVKIKFVVEDSGIGMDSEKTKSVFSETESSDETAKKLSLKLPKLKKMVETEGGKISVQSRPNVGSIFVVTLAFEKVDESEKLHAEKLSAKSENKLKSKKFLIVDNNEIDLLILKNLVTFWEAEIITAVSSKDAINKAEKFNIDLCIIDLSQADNFGFKTAKELRVKNYEFPILGLSSSKITDAAKNALEYGVSGVIKRPFKPSDIKQVVLDLLKGKSQSPPALENNADKSSLKEDAKKEK